MNLISSLLSGIAAAANGWAEVYIRGTSTRATVYYDFEASTSDSSGDNIDLDAYGSVEVYVNQLVDVVAKSADGTVVRSWTDGYASGNVEVISPAFTGNDYVSGAAAVNEPTTLQAVLNLWATNAGAPDWKVDIGGVDKTLLDAFGATTGLVYNVKAPEYGAVGDGVANDQAAIQAAIADAVAAGGGIVFFPVGTYLTTSVIDLNNGVSYVGVGSDKSIITVNSASANVLRLAAASALDAPFVLRGLTLQSSQANAASQLYLNADCKCIVSGCVFGGSALATGSGIEYNADVELKISGCVFNCNSPTLPVVVGSASSNTSRVQIFSCTVIGPEEFNGRYFDLRNTAHAYVDGCLFDDTVNGTFGTHYAITATNETLITGNSFRGGVTFTGAIEYDAPGVSIASGNSFESCEARYVTADPLPSGSHIELAGTWSDSGAGSSFTIPDGYDAYVLVSTGTVPTVTLPQVLVHGQELTVFIRNSSAGNWVTGPTYPGMGGIANVTLASSVNMATTVVQQFTAAELETPGTVLFRAVGP